MLQVERALCLAGGEGRLVGAALLLDVLFQDRERRPTTRDDTIGTGPEYGLAIDPLESVGELLAEQPRTRRFEIVYEPGQIQVGG